MKYAWAPKRKQKGFTIVELLIVIVIIAILAAVSIVAYTGIQNRAAETALQSDLRGAGTQLQMDNTVNGSYPTSIEAANNNRGLSRSAGTEFRYISHGDSYCLTAVSDRPGVGAFHISSETGRVEEGPCAEHSDLGGDLPAGYEEAPLASGGSSNIGGYSPVQPVSCPSNGGNWVKVPGNTLYGLANGFCVQQYPASNVNGVATSQANSSRWTAVTRAAAQTAAQNIDDGTHLLTEYEWMTIAANAAMQPANWSGGSVGSGLLPTGSSTSTRGTFSVVLSNGQRIYFDTGSSSYYASVEFTCYTGASASSCGIAAQHQPSPANAFHTDQFQSSVASYGALQTSGSYFYGDPRFANPGLASSISTARNTGLGYLRSSYAAGSAVTYNTTRGFWTGANTSGLFSLQFLTTDTYAHATYGFRAAK